MHSSPLSPFLGALALALLMTPLSAAAVPVEASVETDPVPSAGDAADDPAVWLHPTDPASSRIYGTDKLGGMAVYDLAGSELQYVAGGRPNNAEVRYGLPLGGDLVDVVVAGNRLADSIVVWEIDPVTGLLSEVTTAGGISTGIDVYGFCMYRSMATGSFYGLVNAKNGVVEQYELFDDGVGGVDGTLVRTFDVGTQVEGCVADDELGWLYIGEENVAIWRYGAEPGDGTTRTQVDAIGPTLTDDVEGLTIYYGSGGTGYLIASSQGSNDYAVYEREGSNTYLGRFNIPNGALTDGTGDTDGIVVTSAGLGASFPSGLFVAQDCCNGSELQNYKVVAWEDIAAALSLAIDPTDPRDLLPPCANGMDDDGDGDVDLADVGCADGGVTALEAPACNDGIDNDMDTFIDFDGGLAALGYVIGSPDPQCGSSSKNRESNRCGLGVELVVALPLLLGLRRRRR